MRRVDYWEIRNREGGKVTRRATFRGARELLDKYAGTKHWDEGPYTIWRVVEERRLIHRPRTTHPTNASRARTTKGG